jgi:hypothetical protein
MMTFLAVFLAILAAAAVMLIVWRIYKRVEKWRAAKAMKEMMEEVDRRVTELKKAPPATK